MPFLKFTRYLARITSMMSFIEFLTFHLAMWFARFSIFFLWIFIGVDLYGYKILKVEFNISDAGLAEVEYLNVMPLAVNVTVNVKRATNKVIVSLTLLDIGTRHHQLTFSLKSTCTGWKKKRFVGLSIHQALMDAH